MTFNPGHQTPQQWPPRHQQQPYAGQWPPPQQYPQPQAIQPWHPQQQYPPQQWQQPYPQPQYPPQPPAMAIAPKSPGVALLLSLLIPGVGSIYAGSVALGVIILVLWIISDVLVFFLIGWLLAPACWIWGMIAAYMNAQRWNREHGIIS